MNDILRKMIFGFFLMGAGISIIIAVKCTLPKQREWAENKAYCAQLQDEVDEIRADITQTKRNIDRFKTSPYFIERLARKNHRVADNEVVFIFQ